MENETQESTAEKTASEMNEEQLQDEQTEVVSEVETQETGELKLKKEVQEWKDKYFYIAAEMQNALKRAEKERENLLKYGQEKLLKSLIEVVDNFDRSIEVINAGEDEKLNKIVEGINMVKKVFLDKLEKEGLKRLNSLGQEFDPNFHEALTQMRQEGKKENEIIQVFEEGYELNGRLIRAAKVVIAKN